MGALGFFGGSAGGGEILLILLVALLLFGSKNLPQVARTIGKTLEQIRRAAGDVRDEVMKADPELPKDDDAPNRLPPAPRPPEDASDARVAR